MGFNPVEVQLFSAAPIRFFMNVQNNTDHISNKDSSLDLNLKKLHLCIAKDNSSELIQFIKDLHNADIAEIIQNLDDDTRLEFIKKIKENR